jgi:transposase, IS30 family
MSYSHLSVHERYIINHMHMAKRTQTAIALELGRSKSTISRELRRNAAPAPGPYWDYRAQELATARRAAPLTPYKLSPGPLLDAVKADSNLKCNTGELK